MKDYILFIPPIEVVGTDPKSWNMKQARVYYNWLMSVKDDRVTYLITVLDETLTNNDESDLKRVGEKVTELLFTPPFSEEKENGLILTNKGLAILADLALFISQLIIKAKNEINWDIVKRPKSDISYHLPALFGFPKIGYRDLIGAAIANGRAILRNEETATIWLKMYLYAIDLFH